MNNTGIKQKIDSLALWVWYSAETQVLLPATKVIFLIQNIDYLMWNAERVQRSGA